MIELLHTCIIVDIYGILKTVVKSTS